MVDIVNMITDNMRKKWLNFEFEGGFSAQGEDMDDRWNLLFDDEGVARREEVVIVGTRITCPHCAHELSIKENK